MHAASSKLSGSSGCLLSTFSSNRSKWVHHLAAARIPQQQQLKKEKPRLLKCRWLGGVPQEAHGFVSTLSLARTSLSAARRELLVVASSDDKGNGSTNSDGALSGYQLPPKEIREIVDAPPTPALSFSPKRDEILFLQRRSLPPVSELAKLELKLGGLRIDPDYNSRSRM